MEGNLGTKILANINEILLQLDKTQKERLISLFSTHVKFALEDTNLLSELVKTFNSPKPISTNTNNM